MKTKKEKPLTFGKVFDEAVAKQHYGMVYAVTFITNGVVQTYVGSKCFYKKHMYCNDWMTYMTSSKLVKTRIKKGEPCTFTVLKWEKLNTKQQILAEEYKTIRAVWDDCIKSGHRKISLNFAIGKMKRGW
jgi:hypothetical protein